MNEDWASPLRKFVSRSQTYSIIIITRGGLNHHQPQTRKEKSAPPDSLKTLVEMNETTEDCRHKFSFPYARAHYILWLDNPMTTL